LASAVAALVGLSLKSERKTEGGFVNDSFQMGHLLRDRAGFPPRSALKNSPSSLSEAESPASALLAPLQARLTDFVLLEMNAQPAATRAGENEITAYPWAAHYVPVPGPKAEICRDSSKIWES